jgi:hypothetical protein
MDTHFISTVLEISSMDTSMDTYINKPIFNNLREIKIKV